MHLTRFKHCSIWLHNAVVYYCIWWNGAIGSNSLIDQIAISSPINLDFVFLCAKLWYVLSVITLYFCSIPFGLFSYVSFVSFLLLPVGMHCFYLFIALFLQWIHCFVDDCFYFSIDQHKEMFYVILALYSIRLHLF